MPAPYPRRGPQQSQARAVNRGARGPLAGRAAGASPVTGRQMRTTRADPPATAGGAPNVYLEFFSPVNPWSGTTFQVDPTYASAGTGTGAPTTVADASVYGGSAVPGVLINVTGLYEVSLTASNSGPTYLDQDEWIRFTTSGNFWSETNYGPTFVLRNTGATSHAEKDTSIMYLEASDVLTFSARGGDATNSAPAGIDLSVGGLVRLISAA